MTAQSRTVLKKETKRPLGAFRLPENAERPKPLQNPEPQNTPSFPRSLQVGHKCPTFCVAGVCRA